MEKIRNHAAGIDIGAQKVYVATEAGEVRSFETYSQDFRELAAYLREAGIATVAMEATGPYWIVLYEILVAAGLDVWLVDGRQTKQVPGRKTDVKDCQWIQQLHSYGLLSRCVVTTGQLKELRSYQRLREDHIRSASMHVNHMQKALLEMNLRLPQALRQVHGKSGMAMIEAILAGERNPHTLLALCHQSIRKNKPEAVLKALDGYYTEAGLFALRQAYDAYWFYQEQISACDAKMEEVLEAIREKQEPEGGAETPIAGKRKPIRHHKPDIKDLGQHLLCIFQGRDATQLSGITDYTWLQLYTEIGSDLSKWPTEKHFTSWLGLAPGQNNSGKKKGKVRKKGRPKAGQIFRGIAQSLLNSKHIGWGAFARRLRGRKGPGIAIKATARKLAVQYWRLMVKGQDFVEQGIVQYETQVRIQKERAARRLALELNMDLVQLE